MTRHKNAAPELAAREAAGRQQHADGGILSFPIVPHLESTIKPNTLFALAAQAKSAGDYQRFWDLRRRGLLLQVALYDQE